MSAERHPRGGGQSLGPLGSGPAGKPACHTREFADRVSPRKSRELCRNSRAFSGILRPFPHGNPVHPVPELRTLFARHDVRDAA
jgi:hypothetical protein